MADQAKPTQQEIDEQALERFTEAVGHKLARSRAKGRDGWQDPDLCPVERLAGMLIGHLGKANDGTMIDIATFAMMLHERGAHPSVLLQAMFAPRPVSAIREDCIRWDDGTEVPIGPVWVLDINGVRLEIGNEAKALAIAEAINERARPRADLDLITNLCRALTPLAEFAEIPGAACAPGDVAISKGLEGQDTPRMTFSDARRAKELLSTVNGRWKAFEETVPVDAASAASVAGAFSGLKEDLGGLPDQVGRDDVLALVEGRLGQLMGDMDAPRGFRDAVARALDEGRPVSSEAQTGPSRVELIRALEPFARFGMSEDGDILSSLTGNRIRDWFGPSDFRQLRAIFSLLAGDDLPDPYPEDAGAAEPEGCPS